MKTNAVLALFLVVAVVLVSGCQGQSIAGKGQKVEGWAARIGGSYKGGIWTGKTRFPGTTKFNVDAKGLLSGTYELDEKGTTVPGTLSDFRVAGNRQLECRWKDKNGTGDLKMTFTDNLSSFKGFWSLDGKEQKHPWNGTR